MKALSIRQPWAWAILHAGKDIENRDWQPINSGLRYRGSFLIHASGGMTRAEYADGVETIEEIVLVSSFPYALQVPAAEDLPRGGIVGAADLVDVVRESTSPWFFGPVGLVLRRVTPLPFRAVKGALGFFEVPA